MNMNMNMDNHPNEETFEIELAAAVSRPKINKNRRKVVIKTHNYEQEIKRRFQRKRIKLEMDEETELLECKSKKIVYSNQQEAANKVIQAYDEGVLAVCLIAQPGTGKTGTAQAVMYHYATHDEDDKFIYTENMIVCSGMSDNDWEKQFKKGILPSFKEQVYHRQNLIKKEQKLRDLKNGLIIPDECHIASSKNMTVAKCMKSAGLLDIEILKAKKIKTLDISATPEAVLHDYAKWGPLARVIKITPGPTYKGFEVMLAEKRILDAPQLETLEDIEDLLNIFEERYENSSTKKYFPFRLFNNEDTEAKKTHIRYVCEDLGWAIPLEHDSENRISNIDLIMESPPEEHQIIFIKGFWRASKRLIHQHCGGSYEQKPKKQNMSNTAQALPARHCDNFEYSGEQLDPSKRPLHFCDKSAIEGYVEWFNKGCDYTKTTYKSLRINSNGEGKVSAKASKVHHTLVSNLPTSDSSDEEDEENKKDEKNKKNEVEEPTEIIKMDTLIKIKEWFKTHLTPLKYGVGPKIADKEKNKKGNFYTCITQFDKEYKIRTTQEFGVYESNKTWGFRGQTEASKEKNKYRVYPVYSNIEDHTSLQWWLVYY
jgi:hypothetical protein